MKISRYLITLATSVLASCITYSPTTVTFLPYKEAAAPAPLVLVIKEKEPVVVPAPVAVPVPVPAASAPVVKLPIRMPVNRGGCGAIKLPELTPPAKLTVKDLDDAKVPNNPMATSVNLQNLMMDRLIRVSRYNDEIKSTWAKAVEDHNHKCDR